MGDLEERRTNTIEMILKEIGELNGKADAAAIWLKNLNDKVQHQNGRVAALENWKAFVYGAITVIVLMVVPIFVSWASGKL